MMGARFSIKWMAVLGRIAMILVGMVLMVVTIAWLSGMFEDKVAPGWSQRAVRKLETQPTDQVHEVYKAQSEEAIGTLKASSRMVVASQVLATIESVNVSAGDQVEAGQELIRLDAKELDARLSQAKRGQEAAAARRLQAESEYRRIKTLFDQKAISRSDFDVAVRNLQVALAEEERSKQAVQESVVQMSYTKIIASKAGRIVDRLAEPGDIAKPGEPLLVLYDATSLRLEAPVNESLAVQLALGTKVNVIMDATGQTYVATIDEIVPQADAPSRSFLVKATLPATEGLYEGMFGRLEVPTGERRHLCLQTSAIIRIGQLEFVDVVMKDGTLERRLVKIGQLGMPGRQEVLSGVEAGETVILQNDTPAPPLSPELLEPQDSLPNQLQPTTPDGSPNGASFLPNDLNSPSLEVAHV